MWSLLVPCRECIDQPLIKYKEGATLEPFYIGEQLTLIQIYLESVSHTDSTWGFLILQGESREWVYSDHVPAARGRIHFILQQDLINKGQPGPHIHISAKYNSCSKAGFQSVQQE